MKVLVLGVGVAGVSCAWYLAEAGHEVTVIDRAEDVASPDRRLSFPSRSR